MGTLDCSRESLPRRLLQLAWPLLLIPTVLSVIFLAYDPPQSILRVVFVWFFNFIISVCIGGSIFLSYEFLFQRLVSRIPGNALQLFLHLFCVGTGALAGTELSLVIIRLLFGPDTGATRNSIFAIAIVIAIVSMGAEIVLERSKARQRQAELREAQAKKEALNAQLQALQSRTNPHFLFNSLNAIAGLIQEDPVRAEAAIEKLAEIMRYSLDGARHKTVPLSKEIQAVQKYLEVESMRFGDRLTTHVNVEPGTEELSVPPLVLQPLVENAVLHGIAPQRQGGTVEVRAFRNNGSLVLSVEDDGPGEGKSQFRGNQIALTDLRERLQILYGSPGLLTTYRSPRGGYGIRLDIPLGQDLTPSSETS